MPSWIWARHLNSQIGNNIAMTSFYIGLSVAGVLALLGAVSGWTKRKGSCALMLSAFVAFTVGCFTVDAMYSLLMTNVYFGIIMLILGIAMIKVKEPETPGFWGVLIIIIAIGALFGGSVETADRIGYCKSVLKRKMVTYSVDENGCGVYILKGVFCSPIVDNPNEFTQKGKPIEWDSKCFWCEKDLFCHDTIQYTEEVWNKMKAEKKNEAEFMHPDYMPM